MSSERPFAGADPGRPPLAPSRRRRSSGSARTHEAQRAAGCASHASAADAGPPEEEHATARAFVSQTEEDEEAAEDEDADLDVEADDEQAQGSLFGDERFPSEAEDYEDEEDEEQEQEQEDEDEDGLSVCSCCCYPHELDGSQPDNLSNSNAEGRLQLAGLGGKRGSRSSCSHFDTFGTALEHRNSTASSTTCCHNLNSSASTRNSPSHAQGQGHAQAPPQANTQSQAHTQPQSQAQTQTQSSSEQLGNRQEHSPQKRRSRGLGSSPRHSLGSSGEANEAPARPKLAPNSQQGSTSAAGEPPWSGGASLAGEQEAAAKTGSERAQEDSEREGQVDEQERESALTKRRYVLTELVETERDYVNDLGKIVEGYLEEIRRQLVDSGVADILTTGVLPAPSERPAEQQASGGSAAGGPNQAQGPVCGESGPPVPQTQEGAPGPPGEQVGVAAGSSAAEQQTGATGAASNTSTGAAAWPKLPEAFKEGKHKIIFGNIEAIYEFHRDHFLAELERCLDEPHRLGPLFKRYERRLNMYVVYCQNKPRSEAIVSEHLDTYFEVSRSGSGKFCKLFENYSAGMHSSERHATKSSARLVSCHFPLSLDCIPPTVFRSFCFPLFHCPPSTVRCTLHVARQGQPKSRTGDNGPLTSGAASAGRAGPTWRAAREAEKEGTSGRRLASYTSSAPASPKHTCKAAQSFRIDDGLACLLISASDVGARFGRRRLLFLLAPSRAAPLGFLEKGRRLSSSSGRQFISATGDCLRLAGCARAPVKSGRVIVSPPVASRPSPPARRVAPVTGTAAAQSWAARS